MAIPTAAIAWRHSRPRQVLRYGFCLAFGATFSTHSAVLYNPGEYPTSFRSPLDRLNHLPAEEAAAQTAEPKTIQLRMRCHCGRCSMDWDVKTQHLSVTRCYCPACRHFQASAFAAYLAVSVPLELTGSYVQKLRGTCETLDTVERLLCSKCFTKLAVLPLGRPGEILLSLGSVADNSIPAWLTSRWQTCFEEWSRDSEPLWWRARPGPCALPRRSLQLQGGCACGRCSFEAELLPGEAQHCYCKLCRQMSGSAAQTWLPAPKESFRWTRSAALQLMRTTGHGQRHVCTACGTVMTIVYDSQPDCIWPAAGTIDDAKLRKLDVGAGRTVGDTADPMWYRVIHICCAWMQSWYQLPDDGLPRLKFAG
ncbi:unnamed protein product [Symbiodinium microadriaticum]|nr:unnamed protein product [Symbiodinium microadriaticum]